MKRMELTHCPKSGGLIPTDYPLTLSNQINHCPQYGKYQASEKGKASKQKGNFSFKIMRKYGLDAKPQGVK